MILRIALAALLMLGSVAAQVLTVPSTPVAPGAQLPITITNTFPFPIGTDLFVLTGTGDLVLPRIPGCSDAFLGLPPSASLSTYIIPPSAGPGSAGSHLLYLRDIFGMTGSVARFDVQSATPSFPTIHSFPHFTSGFDMHTVSFVYPAGTPWVIANSGAAAKTFLGNDRLDLVAPGAGVVVTLPLAGISLPPGGSVLLTLPVAGLAPGPYKVSVSYSDPQSGTVVLDAGVRDRQHADLHLPFGRTVPVGGSLTAWLSVIDTAAASPGQVDYALAIGAQAGTHALPGSVLVPLVPEPLVIYSLTNALFGLLVNNTGSAMDVSSPNCGDARFVSGDITFFNPNVPLLSGLQLQIAALTYSYSLATFGASQAETIVLQ